jgi:hypothetical protein
VFTARYRLSPYIKQIRFVFKGLKFLFFLVFLISVWVCFFGVGGLWWLVFPLMVGILFVYLFVFPSFLRVTRAVCLSAMLPVTDSFFEMLVLYSYISNLGGCCCSYDVVPEVLSSGM